MYDPLRCTHSLTKQPPPTPMGKKGLRRPSRPGAAPSNLFVPWKLQVPALDAPVSPSASTWLEPHFPQGRGHRTDAAAQLCKAYVVDVARATLGSPNNCRGIRIPTKQQRAGQNSEAKSPTQLRGGKSKAGGCCRSRVRRQCSLENSLAVMAAWIRDARWNRARAILRLTEAKRPHRWYEMRATNSVFECVELKISPLDSRRQWCLRHLHGLDGWRGTCNSP